jgi:chromosome segregation ATPase
LEELSNTVKEKVSGDGQEAPVLDERIKKLKEQKASVGVKQDILNAEFEEFEVRVTECSAETGDLAEDIRDVQEDVQMVNDKIASVERKFEETMVNVRDRITREVTKSGAPGALVMSLDDAAKNSYSWCNGIASSPKLLRKSLRC